MELKPLDGRKFPRFSGICTFFRLPHHPDVDDLDVAVLGVPWDGSVSYRPGARFGPRAVRDASVLMRAYSPEAAIRPFDTLRVADAGDVSVVPHDASATFANIEEHVSRAIAGGGRTVCVGGDHSIALPILRAMAKRHGPVGLVHFDAHSDTYPAAWGNEYHHGTPFRKAVEEGLLDPARVIQIGLRGGLAGADDYTFAKQTGFRMVFLDDLIEQGVGAVAAAIKEVATGKVYLSMDVDAIDPAFAPGTGTPVPGGLTSREALMLIRSCRGVDIVGADVVELSPPYDVQQITALLAAQMAWEAVVLMAAWKAGRESASESAE
jgi:agmatinase